MFRRAKEALSRALRRFLDSIRRSLRGVSVRSLPCAVTSVLRDIDLASRPRILSTQPGLPDPTILSETFRCRLASLNPAIEAKLAASGDPPVPKTKVSGLDVSVDHTEVRSERTSLGRVVVRSAEAAISRKQRVMSLPAVRLETGVHEVREVSFGSAARIRDGERLVVAQPLTRNALDFFRLPADERVGYWHELVGQVGKRPKELELIGVFPGVPVRGIKRIGLQPGSTKLRLWLADKGKRGRSDPPMMTLILARERASGKLLRVFDKRSAGSHGKSGA